jgi:hypothetical protein
VRCKSNRISPELTPAESLAGRRLEFCIELLGDGSARVFARKVEESSLKATELRRAVLFHRLDARFTDLIGCVEAIRSHIQRLADSAQRIEPVSECLFAIVKYERAAWERVQQGLNRWVRRGVLKNLRDSA